MEEARPANGFERLWEDAQAAESAGPPPGGPISGGEGADSLAAALAEIDRAQGDPLEKIRKLLGRALEAIRAERIFFFDATSGTDGPQVGHCRSALNIDLESSHDPESKVPTALLRRALAAGRPIVLEDVDADPRLATLEPDARPRARAGGAVPLRARGRTVGIIYFDHRFQPLVLGARACSDLAATCRLLALLHLMERIEGENRSLWQDIARMKERPTAAAAAAPDSPRSPARARGDRSHLVGNYDGIVGSSPRMLEIFQLLDRISSSTAPILINGESGTGKELIANAVHKNSPRNSKAFVSENCGALTETLLESELFGYVKGAFTGAGKDHKGLFELADGGTLFLDEVGDMSASMQKKLLRVLQEGMIRRVGGKDFIHVDVRLVCATNKDLMAECRQGNFREDLYYRLNVINIKMPALRERKEDIPELVEHFLAEMARVSGTEKKIEPAAVERMLRYAWPGNIRELQNEVKRMYALSEGMIRVSDLSEIILEGGGRDILHAGLEAELNDLTLHEATERVEKELIRKALISSRGNKSMVAKKLQIPKTSLYSKINKYQLDKEMS